MSDENAQRAEMLKGMFDFANAAIRSTILVNGAAVIALLAFLGHVIGSGVSESSLIVSAISTPISRFAWGTVVGITIPAFSYLAQVIWVEASITDRPRMMVAEIFRVLAIIAALAGIGLFASGVHSSINAFAIIAEGMADEREADDGHIPLSGGGGGVGNTDQPDGATDPSTSSSEQDVPEELPDVPPADDAKPEYPNANGKPSDPPPENRHTEPTEVEQ